MKKKILIVLMSLGMAFNTCAFTGYADGAISVTLNGDKIEFDVPPQLIDNRTMVPLRKIFEAMGAVVDWNDNTQTVTATKDDKVVTAKINDRNLYINGAAKTLDVPPMIVDGRTLVPARFVAESFGANVDWVDSTQTVVILTKWNGVGVVPCYSTDPDVPDFGKILGVEVDYSNIDSDGSLYDYSLETLTPDDTKKYTAILKQEGFEPYLAGDDMYVYKKGDRSVMISFFMSLKKISLLIETGQFGTEDTNKNQITTSIPTQTHNSYSHFGITYTVPETWGEPTLESGNINFYPANGMFLMQHQTDVNQQIDEEAVKTMLSAISERTTNYNLISIDKINSSNIPNGYFAEYTATISGKNVRAKTSVIQNGTSMFILSYFDFNASNKVEQLDDVVDSITFDKR